LGDDVKFGFVVCSRHLAHAFVLDRLCVPLSQDQSPPAPPWCFAIVWNLIELYYIDQPKASAVGKWRRGYAEEEHREQVGEHVVRQRGYE
jgi:hypothetical protein